MTICFVLFVLGLLLSVIAFRIKKGKTWLFLLASVCLLELTAALAYRAKNGYLVYNQRVNENKALFIDDSYAVCQLKPSIDTVIHGNHVFHNSHSWRSQALDTTKQTIVCIGGSTTYGVGVSNHETWPYLLQNKVGDSISVINLGIPGHATYDHFSTMLRELPKINPAITIFHVGLNNMRLSHLSNNKNNIEHYHTESLRQSVGLNFRSKLPRCASVHFLYDLIRLVGLAPKNNVPHAMEADDVMVSKDQVKAIYKNHLNQLITLAKQYSQQILFVPQVLIPDAFVNQQYEWWAPNIPDSMLVPLMHEFNAITEQVALNNNVVYVKSMEQLPVKLSHFGDPSHLNAAGNQLFADTLSTYINHTYFQQR